MAQCPTCFCCANMPGSPEVKEALHSLQIYPSDAASLQIREYVPSAARRNTFRSTTNDTKAPAPPLPAKPFPLLKLPAEIRNMIYTYCLVDPCYSISIGMKHDRAVRRLQKSSDFTMIHGKASKDHLLAEPNHLKTPLKWRINHRLAVQLLRANRQIYTESVTILYAQNLFSFMDPKSMSIFLRSIGSHILSIRRVSVLYWGTREHPILKERGFCELAKAVNLESLTLEGGCLYSLTKHRNSFPDAISFYNVAHPWLWTTLGRNGGDLEAVLGKLHLFSASDVEGVGEEAKGGGKRVQQVQVFAQLKAHFVSKKEDMYEEAFRETLRQKMSGSWYIKK